MTHQTIIRGVGGFVPGQPVTNHDLIARGVDTDDDWIKERTGIAARHIAADGVMTSDLAAEAARRALAHAGWDAAEVDLIVLATTTPDLTFPATAVRVQAALGCRAGIPAFDVQAVCSGFIYAMATANGLMKSGLARRALVIGAETMSRILDWSDRSTCVLFGDGAGAVALEYTDAKSTTNSGIISSHIHADGKYLEKLRATGGVSHGGGVGLLTMDGKEVYRHAVNNLAGVVDETLLHNNIKPDAIDWLIPHQANIRIIESTAKKLDMPMDRVIVNIDRYGNTSAASVPLALADGVQSGRIQPGQLCLLEAMGAGFTWGAVLLRY